MSLEKKESNDPAFVVGGRFFPYHLFNITRSLETIELTDFGVSRECNAISLHRVYSEVESGESFKTVRSPAASSSRCLTSVHAWHVTYRTEL